MRFENDARDDARDPSRWLRRPALKSAVNASDVVHHNTLNARPVDDELERSREVERFFDLMTPSPSTPSTPSRGTPR